MKIEMLKSNATLNDVIVAFNEMVEINANLADENVKLKNRLDLAAKVIKELQRKVNSLTGTSTLADDVKDKVRLNVINGDLIGQVKDTLSDFNTTIDQKAEAARIGEELIQGGGLTEKQASMLRNFIDRFNKTRKMIQKKMDKFDPISISVSDEMKDALRGFKENYEKASSLHNAKLTSTEDFKDAAINGVQYANAINKLIDNGERLPVEVYNSFKTHTNGTSKLKMMDSTYALMFNVYENNGINEKEAA